MIKHYPNVCGTPHWPSAATVITLDDMDDWDAFAEQNREGLESAYGSVAEAFQHAIQGGLQLGGGAAPLVDIVFLD